MTLLPALVLLPALGAAGAAAHRSGAYRTVWLVALAFAHLALTIVAWVSPPGPALDGWLALDAPGLLVLTVTSLLFAAAAVYAVGYLRRESPRGGRAFVSCLLAFLAAASLVAESHHFALLWVGLEAMTLAVAPLIYHHHDRRSLEAVWKYLMLSSVGIALALLGTFLLAASQSAVAGTGRPLMVEDLMAAATRLDPRWLRAASVFLLVGFGTKMGLVPLHAWKPVTYGEAPSLVAGLMAGALTTGAFLALARVTGIVVAAGQGSFLLPLLIAFGVASIATAAVCLAAQSDPKRLLAWSSIEHMGLLVLGLGLGAGGVYGSLLHSVNNGLAKGLLFLAIGNVTLVRRQSATQPVGLASAILLVAGLFAVTGSPLFGTFVSEFTIVRAAFATGHAWVGIGTVTALALAFLGMARVLLALAYAPGTEPRARESAWLLAGPFALLALLVTLGTWLPPFVDAQVARAAGLLGGGAP